MSNFLVNSDQVALISDDCRIEKQLPPRVYTMKLDNHGNMLLCFSPDFVIPEVRLGNLDAQADRIINTFNDREKTTGVLLSGFKGTGKTLLTKVVAAQLMEAGYPIIIINSDIPANIISMYIDSIVTPCVVLFDEIEKNFGDKAQDKLLGMLDGLQSSKKLFMFTCNQSNKINSYMLNRPGRIFYHIAFNDFDEQIIHDYCRNHGYDREFSDQVVTISTMVGDFSYDILVSIVEECTRYNESPAEAIRMLNITPSNNAITYDIELNPVTVLDNPNHELVLYDRYIDFDVHAYLTRDVEPSINIDIRDISNDKELVEELYYKAPAKEMAKRKPHIEQQTPHGILTYKMRKYKAYNWSAFL